MRRHFDQACRIDSESRPPIPASEIFDTLGLAARLAAVEDRPLPLDARSDAVRWHTLDFITRYARSGRPSTSGVWTTTLDSADAVVAGSILTARIRPLPGLLRSEGFRTVVVFAPRPTLEVAAPVVCLPHIVHEEGQRPTGLPTDVSTWREFRSSGRSARSPGQATLRIALDRRGVVVALDSVAGGSAAVAAARNVVRGLRFDPALRNGEPVLGELVQSFAFGGMGRPGRAAGEAGGSPTRPRETFVWLALTRTPARLAVGSVRDASVCWQCTPARRPPLAPRPRPPYHRFCR